MTEWEEYLKEAGRRFISGLTGCGVMVTYSPSKHTLNEVVADLLQGFLEETEVIDFMNEGQCDDCERPSGPMHNEGYQ